MEIQQILSFGLASFLMAMMPGPDNLYVLTESLSKGKRNGLWIAFGLNSGVLLHTSLAATGLSLILKESELAFQIIQYAGAAYLLYLAYGAYQEPALDFSEPQDLSNEQSAWSLYRTGLTMNVLNPKVSLFFIAFLPQFVQAESDLKPSLQMICFGILFMLIGWLTFSAIALLAAQLRRIAQGDKFARVSKWLKVTVLIALGVYLLLPI